MYTPPDEICIDHGTVESLNPAFSFTLTKNMMRCDPCCEWVVQRKR